MYRSIALALAACAAPACANQPPSPAAATAPTAARATADAALIDERKLLCARIGAATSWHEEVAQLDLEGEATEGGSASVFVADDLVRIDAGLMYESLRETLDARYRAGDLVCTRSIRTTIHTIEERSAENPDGRPPTWRVDFRVFAAGKQIYATFDDAPAGAGDERDLPSTLDGGTRTPHRTLRTDSESRRSRQKLCTAGSDDLSGATPPIAFANF
jgi:hypothetical protein